MNDVDETVYGSVAISGASRIYSKSSIRTWEGWPDDVVEIVRGWNRDRRLRFVYLPGTFHCPDCRRRIDSVGSTSCRLAGLFLCDDCVIARARKYGRRGRPETELEKAKRITRELQTRAVRLRYNVEHEQAYVVEMLKRVDDLAERAETSLLEDVEGMIRTDDAEQMLAEIRDIARRYLAKHNAG